MKTMIPRLHSVRLKAGGAKLRIMPSPRSDMSRELQCALQSEADQAWDAHKDMVAGFSFVLWTANGDAASVVYNTRYSPIPNSAVTHLVEETTRRSIIKVQIDSALGQDDSTA